ncbi:MAG: hypothetical protein WA631_11455, partial [Nitrososphaeraceae archaeon]
AKTILEIDKSRFAHEELAPPGLLPSIQNPNVYDWNLSPTSFAVNPAIAIGEGSCETLLPSNTAQHEFRFRLIIYDDDCEMALLPKNGFHPMPSEANLRSTQMMHDTLHPLYIRKGTILEYKISWIPVGHSLGDIVYSVLLTPHESINLAVIEWSRDDTYNDGDEKNNKINLVQDKDSASSVKNSNIPYVSEGVLHNRRRDKNIEDIVKVAMSEWQRGKSVLINRPNSSCYRDHISFSGAVGNVYATNNSTHGGIIHNTAQTLANNIVQASNKIRSLSSTIVVQGSEQETKLLQIRTVTNHNRFHTMSVSYYEVLRHYKVVTECVNIQNAVLIKHPIIYFDENEIIRYRLILEKVLLDESLCNAFDAVSRVQCTKKFAEDSLAQFVFSELQVRIDLGLNSPTNSDNLYKIHFSLEMKDGSVIRCKTKAAADQTESETGDKDPYNCKYPNFVINYETYFNLKTDLAVQWPNIAFLRMLIWYSNKGSQDNWNIDNIVVDAQGEFGSFNIINR